jgi:transposase-like protein
MAAARYWASTSTLPRLRSFWTEFLRSPACRGLYGVKLVISDAHEGLRAAVSRVLVASWQRCRAHFMRNALAHSG